MKMKGKTAGACLIVAGAAALLCHALRVRSANRLPELPAFKLARQRSLPFRFRHSGPLSSSLDAALWFCVETGEDMDCASGAFGSPDCGAWVS